MAQLEVVDRGSIVSAPSKAELKWLHSFAAPRPPLPERTLRDHDALAAAVKAGKIAVATPEEAGLS